MKVQERMDELVGLLRSYADELEVNRVTVGELIDSHRRLREQNRIHQEEWDQVLKDARERGHEEGKRVVMEEDYISRQRRKGMTLREIVEWLNEESE